MWFLQFKDNVKSNVRMDKERDRERLAAFKAEIADKEAQLPEFEKVFRKIGNSILSATAVECNNQIKINNELIDKVKEVSQGFAQAASFKAKEIDTEKDLIELKFEYSAPSTASLRGAIVIYIERVFGESVQYH